jgi:hypothetical protein
MGSKHTCCSCTKIYDLTDKIIGMNRIIERIERETGISNLVPLLAGLEPTDLQSLLLEVYRQLAGKRKPSDVLAEYETNRFVRPSMLSPKRVLEWERLLLAELPDEVDMLELSPLCPLGTNSVIAGVDQNWSVSTSRNTEVVSDSTNVLALECAVRRRQLMKTQPKSAETIHLAASHRLLRTQNYGDPKTSAHFRLFTMCSAGRDRGNLSFEFSALALQIRFYLSALRNFLGADVELKVSVSDFSEKNLEAVIHEQLFIPIQEEFVNVDCVLDKTREGGRVYYQNLCFKIHARTNENNILELADGGVVDWTQKLLANAKERLVISGLSSQRVCMELPS